MKQSYIENKLVWTKKDQRQIEEQYFKVIKITDRYCEIMSLNTEHCWIIYKSILNSGTIVLYHKHSLRHPYYHKHWEASSVVQIISSIKNHDKYVLSFL